MFYRVIHWVSQKTQ